MAGLLFLGFVASACGGSPPDLGTVEPRELDQPGPWKLLVVEGIIPMAERIEPAGVEVDADGRSMTVFFLGGDPDCYGLADVDVVRHDPDPPSVTVAYGLRLGVSGCNAALALLATRVGLDPPFDGD